MSVPGFTADSAVYRTNGHYRTTSGGGSAGYRQIITLQDGFCRLVECPVICNSACRGGPESARCEQCMKRCKMDCDSDVDDPFANRRA
ncbi:hypothetical protein [Kitasatospora sp. NPDC050463]|uniref:hypothetical protein n=1 Tax=Kitasatospora sp. NPDC050463 TaxID=3155786 RepID=UPI00340C1ECD